MRALDTYVGRHLESIQATGDGYCLRLEGGLEIFVRTGESPPIIPIGMALGTVIYDYNLDTIGLQFMIVDVANQTIVDSRQVEFPISHFLMIDPDVSAEPFTGMPSPLVRPAEIMGRVVDGPHSMGVREGLQAPSESEG